jgi:integrase
MTARKGRRRWGYVVQLPNKSKRFEASYIGPDRVRHYAPTTFTLRSSAEGWLANERAFIERCAMTGEPWTTPKQRTAATQAQSITVGEYSRTWIQNRNVKSSTRKGYESLLNGVIGPGLGDMPLRSLSSDGVRAWHSSLGTATPRRRAHAYGLLHAILATAVETELIAKNPCQIKRAMNTNRKREPIILDVGEVAALADAIGERWRALVLLSAWCGLRWGEVTELRRSDIGSGCETVSITRGVTHRSGVCTVGGTKSDANRTVVIPPHIRADVKAHLDSFVGRDDSALLFVPVRGGCHVNDKVFAASYFKPALNSIGRESVRHHDLRHFAGTMTARVGGSISETMARLGHSTSKASLMYQAAVDERQAVIAEALSKLAAQPRQEQNLPVCGTSSHVRALS